MNNYVLAYDICALCICFITAFFYYTKKNIRNFQHFLFGMLTFSVTLATFFDCLSAILIANHAPDILCNLVTIIFFFFHVCSPFLFAVYVIIQKEIKHKTSILLKLAIILPLFIYFVILFLTPLTGWIFTYNPIDGYQRGSLKLTTYFILFYYPLVSVIYVTRRHKLYAKSVCNTIYVYFFICLLPVIVQFFAQEFLLENFGSSVGILLLMMTLHNHDDIIDSNTGMLNRSSLAEYCNKMMHNKAAFHSIMVRIADYDLLTTTYGIIHAEKLLHNIANYLYRYVPMGDAYYIGNACFIINIQDEDEINTLLGQIHFDFNQPWNIESLEIYFSSMLTCISYPKTAATEDLYFSYMIYFQKMKKQRYGIIPTEELTIKDRLREQKVQQAISRGLEQHLFVLYYQPICTTDTQKFVTAEALIRLTDSELGPVSPAEFIPIAEKNGTILRIGEYVLEEACRFISEHDMDALGLEYIEVNLSVIQCLQRNFIDHLEKTLAKYQVDSKYLCLEITETAANCSPEVFTKHLETLHNMGIKLALDDFGTGYANVHKMMTLPFQIIKFDKEMTNHILNDEKYYLSMKTLMLIMHSLDLLIVAEGVETKEQYERLRNAACDYIQGFYFSKPLPEHEFIHFINVHLKP